MEEVENIWLGVQKRGKIEKVAGFTMTQGGRTIGSVPRLRRSHGTIHFPSPSGLG